jgi:hypothetical protein
MLNPVLHHTQLPIQGFTTGTEAGTGLAESSDTVRYLSDLWENLCELQKILAKDPLE